MGVGRDEKKEGETERNGCGLPTWVGTQSRDLCHTKPESFAPHPAAVYNLKGLSNHPNRASVRFSL